LIILVILIIHACGETIKVLFLDRDGVINEDIGYLHEINKNVFIKNIFSVCKFFKNKGFEIVIITNQSGIGRGYFSEEDFQEFNSWMLKEFKKRGITILDVFYCPHKPETNCSCRKPKPGMFFKAKEKYNIDMKKSWIIGDSIRDIESATKAGVSNSVLLDVEDSQIEVKFQDTYRINSLEEIKGIFKDV